MATREGIGRFRVRGIRGALARAANSRSKEGSHSTKDQTLEGDTRQSDTQGTSLDAKRPPARRHQAHAIPERRGRPVDHTLVLGSSPGLYLLNDVAGFTREGPRASSIEGAAIRRPS